MFASPPRQQHACHSSPLVARDLDSDIADSEGTRDIQNPGSFLVAIRRHIIYMLIFLLRERFLYINQHICCACDHLGRSTQKRFKPPSRGYFPSYLRRFRGMVELSSRRSYSTAPKGRYPPTQPAVPSVLHPSLVSSGRLQNQPLRNLSWYRHRCFEPPTVSIGDRI